MSGSALSLQSVSANQFFFALFSLLPRFLWHEHYVKTDWCIKPRCIAATALVIHTFQKNLKPAITKNFLFWLRIQEIYVLGAFDSCIQQYWEYYRSPLSRHFESRDPRNASWSILFPEQKHFKFLKIWGLSLFIEIESFLMNGSKLNWNSFWFCCRTKITQSSKFSKSFSRTYKQARLLQYIFIFF